MNMDIWVEVIRGSYTEIKFSKNKGIGGKTPFFLKGQFCTPHNFCLITLVLDNAALYGNATFSMVVPSSKKQYSSFLKKI